MGSLSHVITQVGTSESSFTLPFPTNDYILKIPNLHYFPPVSFSPFRGHHSYRDQHIPSLAVWKTFPILLSTSPLHVTLPEARLWSCYSPVQKPLMLPNCLLKSNSSCFSMFIVICLHLPFTFTHFTPLAKLEYSLSSKDALCFLT